jgi:hypothetical protein
MSSYSTLLENPKRRRKGRRRRKSRSRRRSNPFEAMNPRRRRRRSRGRSRRRSFARRRRNPFGLPRLGGFGSALGEGVGLHVAEVAGQVAVRAIGKIMPRLVATGNASALTRAGVGLLAPMVLRMAKVPARWSNMFAAVQVAQALYTVTSPLRNRVMGQLGLGDFVTVDAFDDPAKQLSDDYGLLQDDDEEPDDSGALNDYLTIPE